MKSYTTTEYCLAATRIIGVCSLFVLAARAAADEVHSKPEELYGRFYRIRVDQAAEKLLLESQEAILGKPLKWGEGVVLDVESLDFDDVPMHSIRSIHLADGSLGLCAVLRVATSEGSEFRLLSITPARLRKVPEDADPDLKNLLSRFAPNQLFDHQVIYKGDKRLRVLAVNGRFEGDGIVVLLGIQGYTTSGEVHVDSALIYLNLCPLPSGGGMSTKLEKVSAAAPSYESPSSPDSQDDGSSEK